MRRTFLGAAALLLSLAPLARAHVVINEVLYDPVGADSGNEVIEFHNQDGTPFDLTGFSICANAGPFARTYWNFPAGTIIPAGGFLRVHWIAAGTDTVTDLFTGTSPTDFTCLQPAMPLDNLVGSVSLYASQSCLDFGNPAFIQDFVQWGGQTFRESVAVGAGIWTAGTFLPLYAEGSTIAYDGLGDTLGDFFEDISPTLGAPNTDPGNPATSNYGTGCAGIAGVPVVTSSSGPPALGNASFGIDLQNGLPGSSAVVLLGLAPTSVPLFGCTLLVSPLVNLALPVLPDGTSRLPFPVPDNPALVGFSFFFQWGVVDTGPPNGPIAFTDGLQVDF